MDLLYCVPKSCFKILLNYQTVISKIDILIQSLHEAIAEIMCSYFNNE